MKKFFFTLLFSSIIFQLSAKKVEGYYITLENDTIYCEMDIPGAVNSNGPSLKKVQHEIEVYKSKKEKQSYTPKELKEVFFKYKGRDYKFVSVLFNEARKTTSLWNSMLPPGSIETDTHFAFVQLLEEGYMKLYRYREYDHAYSQFEYYSNLLNNGIVSPNLISEGIDFYFLQKEDQELCF
ncbi:MAG: hypothetical protein JEZ03_17645, partial [Bacteroidales bacterium]|nr:hypothetical protein [Bacteroidales bacterium]